jgi:hypothetical protein
MEDPIEIAFKQMMDPDQIAAAQSRSSSVESALDKRKGSTSNEGSQPNHKNTKEQPSVVVQRERQKALEDRAASYSIDTTVKSDIVPRNPSTPSDPKDLR